MSSRAEAPSAPARRVWHENRPPEKWLPDLDVRELWAEREVALTLALKDIRVRYKQTFLGVAWAVLRPLVGVLILSVIFGRLAQLPADGLPYPVFVYTGLAVWLYFSSAVTTGAQSLVDNRDLVTKVYFPRLLAPLGAVAPDLVDLFVNILIIAVFLGIYSVAPGAELALLPVWILAAVAFAFAVGLWLSALNVKYRDVKHVLPFLLQVWFYVSPVVYASSLVEGGWRYVYALNPIVTVIDGFRWSLAGGPPPGIEALVSLAVGLAILVGGFVYFRRVERYFADLI